MVEINEYEKKCPIIKARKFSEGHAMVIIMDGDNKIPVIIDENGEITSNDKVFWPHFMKGFNNGYAVYRYFSDSDCRNVLCAYMDYEGNILLNSLGYNLHGDDLKNISEDVAWIKYGDLWHAYDITKKEYISEGEYYDVLEYSEGLSFVNIKSDGAGWICIDKEEKRISPYVFSAVSSFIDGVACVKLLGSSRFIYVNKNFENIFGDKSFVIATPFKNGYARVCNNSDGYEVYYIDKCGNKVSDKYPFAMAFNEGRALVSNFETVTVLDENFMEINSFPNEETMSFYKEFNKYILCRDEDGRYYYRDKDGNDLDGNRYYEASIYNEDGIALVKDSRDSNYYYIKDGVSIIEGVNIFVAEVESDLLEEKIILSSTNINTLRKREQEILKKLAKLEYSNVINSYISSLDSITCLCNLINNINVKDSLRNSCFGKDETIGKYHRLVRSK